MKKFRLYHFYVLFNSCRRNILYQLYRNQNLLRKRLSDVSVSKYFLSSMLSSLFAFEVLAKEKQSENHEAIKKADQLYNDAKYVDLYSFLSAYQSTNNPELLWRWARANFEKCKNEIKDDKEKLLYLEEALKCVDKALEIDEQCWAAHKWKAILLDYVWRHKSTKGRIIHSFEVKRHMKRAIELNPMDGTNYYILGEWCYTFADMPWYQRQAAAALFASPPTSTYEEALHYFETAEKVDPLFYSMNLLMLAKCYLKLNNKEKAVECLKMTLNYEVKTSDDEKAHEEAEKLLKQL